MNRGGAVSFCAAINCLDGRTQLPVIRYLQKRFGVDHVDLITDAGPVAILARQGDSAEAEAIRRRVDVSCRAHGSKALAVAAHHGCAGNPVPDPDQHAQLAEAVVTLGKYYPKLTVLALWVDSTWSVTEISPNRD